MKMVADRRRHAACYNKQ